ncbi:hypothetical protein [Yoonia sp.]|uniref:hypothetical protein n=1 Tax=Yoonia sp. TaxID=2212373 RepID=UPI0025E45592|nr:hypothetical protein [Yoonia sp.]
MRNFGLIGVLACFAAGPIAAQAVDFGDDGSEWANDGECDDPRFSGPGMTTTTLLDADILHDATDCRTAYAAGQLSLDGATTKDAAADPVFGNNSSEWAQDGECDDRRFTGAGMAADLLTTGIGTDADDCRAAITAGTVKFWDMTAALQATQCSGINFGSDSGAYAMDAECDDPRFEGLGAASLLSQENMGADATDCRLLCGYGAVALRDY